MKYSLLYVEDEINNRKNQIIYINSLYDFDIYEEYANVIAYNQFNAVAERPYHTAYVSRKNRYQYALLHHQVLEQFGHLIVQHTPISPVIRDALGDYAYILRAGEMETLFPVIEEIHRTR